MLEDGQLIAGTLHSIVCIWKVARHLRGTTKQWYLDSRAFEIRNENHLSINFREKGLGERRLNGFFTVVILYFVLYVIISYSIISYFTILYYTILYYTILYYIILYYIILYYIILYYIILY